MNDAITYKDLELSFGKLLHIEEVHITEIPNEHSTLVLTAVLDADNEKNIFYEIPKIITLFYKDRGRKKILFKGICSSSSIKRNGKHLHVSLEAKDMTYLLDINQKIRTFQNTSETSHEVIDSIISEYAESGCLNNINNVPIEQFLFQYEETDWEFIKRVANKFNGMVYASGLSEKINLRVGISNSLEDFIIEDFFYSIEKNFGDFELSSKNGIDNIFHQQYMKYIVNSYQFISIGSFITFKNKEWCIKETKRNLINGLLINKYTLVQKEEETKPKYSNIYITGISLKGTIVEVKRDQVRAYLQKDTNTTSAGKYWFPYSTVAGSSDGSGWHCMPEKGEVVRIYFPTSDEREVYAISCSAGKTKGSSAKMNPNVRTISTAQGNILNFTNNGTNISVKGGAAAIDLNKSGDINITAAQSITLLAGEKVILESDSISTEGEEKIELICDGGCSISMEETKADIKAIKIYEN